MPGIWSSSSTELKPPCSVAVVEDLLGRGRADAVERVELLEGRGVEVDRLVGGRRGGRGGGRRRARTCEARDRDEDLAAVLELGGAVDLAQVGAAGRAAGALERVLDALRSTTAGRRPGCLTAPATSTVTCAAAARRRRRRPRSSRRAVAAASAAGRERARYQAERSARTRAAAAQAASRRGSRSGMAPNLGSIALRVCGALCQFDAEVQQKCARCARETCAARSDAPLRGPRETGVAARLSARRSSRAWTARRSTFTTCLPSMWARTLGRSRASASSSSRVAVAGAWTRSRTLPLTWTTISTTSRSSRREVGVRPRGLPHALAGQRLVDLGAGVRREREDQRRGGRRGEVQRRRAGPSRAGGRPR